jgi:DNA-binding NtrC family response regulator
MSNVLSILIIEDDKYARLNLREILRPFGVLDEACDVESALKFLSERTYDLVITDIELGEGSGVDLISRIVLKGSHCIVVSSYENESVIEKAYALGARHYLAKFKLKDHLPVYIHKLLQEKNARFEKFLKEEFITQDPDLISDLRRLTDVNWKDQTLLITGPTGTGKSLLGKLIHELTHAQEKLVHINCAEIAENLIESELFGHEKGAFTGADQKKDGKLKLANGGTLFLDEVATMPLSMQQKLLKALDEKTFYPVGSSIPIRSNFTLVTATCEDLNAKIQRREFREDLYFRISGFHFDLKPLSQRADDIELLIKNFQQRSSRRFVIKSEAMTALKRHSWPGNVRELIKVCERLSQGSSGVVDNILVNKVLGPTISPSSQNSSWKEHVHQYGLRDYITQIEKQAVEDALKRHGGKITACIKDLKISSSAFYRILQEHRIQS